MITLAMYGLFPWNINQMLLLFFALGTVLLKTNLGKNWRRLLPIMANWSPTQWPNGAPIMELNINAQLLTHLPIMGALSDSIIPFSDVHGRCISIVMHLHASGMSLMQPLLISWTSWLLLELMGKFHMNSGLESMHVLISCVRSVVVLLHSFRHSIRKFTDVLHHVHSSGILLTLRHTNCGTIYRAMSSIHTM